MSELTEVLPADWAERLGSELESDHWRQLMEFVAEERRHHTVYPPLGQTFAAFEATPYDEVKVVILGQDPYSNEGEAHGLAFSVPRGVTKPASLRNIDAVLEGDLCAPPPLDGNLESWARQGVLLLNTVLTVRAGSKIDRMTHRRWRSGGQGWVTFTNAVVDAVNAKPERVVFMLWGNDARRKEKRIDQARHAVITSSHPSSLSAYRGFLDSRPFSKANELLVEAGREPIHWAR
jgi:uracil-DNA glycosylase